MDIVNMRTNTRGLTYEDLVVGQAYVTGPVNSQLFLCIRVGEETAISCSSRFSKRLVRLEDSSLWCSRDFKDTQEFAPVQAKVVLE